MSADSEDLGITEVPNEEIVIKDIHPLRMMLTGPDNYTHDLIRVLGMLGGVAAILYEGWVVYHTMVFDITNFGVGFLALLTGIGSALKIKETVDQK